jgi:hypothetical protein
VYHAITVDQDNLHNITLFYDQVRIHDPVNLTANTLKRQLSTICNCSESELLSGVCRLRWQPMDASVGDVKFSFDTGSLEQGTSGNEYDTG